MDMLLSLWLCWMSPTKPFIKVAEIKYPYSLPPLPSLVSGTRNAKIWRGCCQDISTRGDGNAHFSVTASISLEAGRVQILLGDLQSCKCVSECSQHSESSPVMLIEAHPVVWATYQANLKPNILLERGFQVLVS